MSVALTIRMAISTPRFSSPLMATIVVSRWEGRLDTERLDAALHGRAAEFNRFDPTTVDA